MSQRRDEPPDHDLPPAQLPQDELPWQEPAPSPQAPDHGPAPLTLAQVWRASSLEVRVDDYGFTGEGFARLADGWLSIRGALPGERVRVALEPGQREGARRLFAQVLEVLEPSASRADPLCPRADVCRGCQLRHMTMREELRWKSASIAQVIARYGQLALGEQPPVELIVVPGLWRGDAERMRSALSYRRTDLAPGFSLGLRSPALGQALVPMHECPALIEPLKRLLRALSAGFEALGAQGQLPSDQADAAQGLSLVRVSCPVHGRGMIVFVLGGSADQPLEGEPEWVTRWLESSKLPELVSVFVERGQQTLHVRGPRRLRLPVAGVTLEVGPRDWFHATLRPAEALYESVVAWLDPQRHERFLDVGCGVGTIGVMVAPRVSAVVGVDINRDSVETAQLNAFALNREGMEVVAGSWENALRRLAAAGQRFEVASINPMREPLGERPLAYLQPLGIKRLLYLGPSPVSAAKDIGLLRGQGWRLTRLGQAALHPATYHTMLVALMERAGG